MTSRASIIPNFFTMSNMLMGFFAIILATKNDPGLLAIAGILVFVGSFFDATDGAVARALKVQNPIGSQLDSLADAISYGIAPGVISYKYLLFKLPTLFLWVDLGMVIATIFPICAIYRLARFNVSHEESGFSGLPSPPAGVLISAIPALAYSEIFFIGKIQFSIPVVVYSIVYCVIALLMVSKIDYSKLFSDLYHKGKAVALGALVLIILLLVFLGMWAVAICTSIYIVLGLLKFCLTFFKK